MTPALRLGCVALLCAFAAPALAGATYLFHRFVERPATNRATDMLAHALFDGASADAN